MRTNREATPWGGADTCAETREPRAVERGAHAQKTMNQRGEGSHMRKGGIQVRHDQESGYMHHKFAIVDQKMLITGSLNWTTQAIQSNRENVLIVEDAEYVKPFLAEFERIWEEYNPANYTFFPKGKK
ncbi:mitochondrial cardiolipin hydrolase [Alligator mississippiensis]|uniref:Mitochondrial cardiolipin hydrolase n=1 Tax=Alligator mississippiensis TaxID=8496 RepID=A0A151N1Z5_ALLMI|nr:mitochondrial cardiolipin hydrolase [Alligator mississippiensis]